jgi:Glycosyl hydrolases family 16
MIRKRVGVVGGRLGSPERSARWGSAVALAALVLIAGSLTPAVASAAPAQEPSAEQSDGNGEQCATGSGQTAAAALGYGEPAFEDDFNSFDEQKWMVYSGPSEHRNGQFEAEGGGLRTREQISVSDDGIMTIRGLPNGHTAGMSTEESHRQQYGLWEARVKLPAEAVNYHSVLILMAGGSELDFMEVMEPTGRRVDGFLHLPGGDDNGRVTLSDNDWHNFAIEWTPERISLHLDGRKWHETGEGAEIPTGDGHMTIQLDWFPSDQGPDNTGTADLSVDWVRIYEASDGQPPSDGDGGDGGGDGGGGQDCAQPCASGVNSLGQCQQDPDGNGGSSDADGCRWWVHPQQEFLEEVDPDAPEGSVLLFFACYDEETGLVTAAPSAPEGSGDLGPVPVRVAGEDEQQCESVRTPGDTQRCYYQLPQGARYHPSVAIGMLLTNSQVQLSEAPALLATPPVGEPAIVDQPTFVCVTNFPSGTNFPGAASVPGARGGEHDEHSSTGGEGADPTRDDAEPRGDEAEPREDDAEPPRAKAERRQQAEPRQDGEQNGGDGNAGDTNGGGASFTPGVVGSLTPGQQACLDAQSGATGAAATGEAGQDDGAEQPPTSGGDRDAGADQGAEDDGGNGGTSEDRPPDAGQPDDAPTGNVPVNGLCAPAAHAPGGPAVPASGGETGPAGTGGETTPPGPGGEDPSTPAGPGGEHPTTPTEPDGGLGGVVPATDTATGNDVGACVRVQLYPVIRWDPGDGTEAFECAAPGMVYDADGAAPEQQVSEAAACTHAYSKATGIEDPETGEARPDEWPGKVSVVWRADWDACLVHAAQGSNQFSAGAGHAGNYVDSTGMNFDLSSLGEGQTPDTGQTGTVSTGRAYAGSYNLGLDDDGVQSAWTPLPREVQEVSGVNTDGGDGG